MALLTHLVGFGLRQVIGDTAANVVDVVEQRFRDHSRTLPTALDQAHQRAWQALGVALVGDGLLDRLKVFFASGDDNGVREQVQLFLKNNTVTFNGTSAEFRQDCLDELKRLRKSGLLSTEGGSAAEIARQAACFKRHTDPQGLIEEARRAVAGVADALAEGYPNLSRLLRTPTPAGPPLLAAAFCYFFRREVETNHELAHGLLFDGQRQLFDSQQEMLSVLRKLSETQENAFNEVNDALETLGEHFDALFEQLGRIEVVVLDVQAEVRRLVGLHFASVEEVRTLREQMQQLLGQLGMQRGEVHPGNSCSIRGEDERRAVKALLARFRQLPSEEQRKMPALLNGLGKLQFGAGDFAEARRTFTEVVQVVGDRSGKAEASYNAYRAALEEKKWDAALAAMNDAASHDPQRFAPFPLHRYEPKCVLGAGGFGTAILCLDRNLGKEVVVKTLHAADLARGVGDVFREAKILMELTHPAIIHVRDCEYADPAHKARPYLVMDYFAGNTLQEYVEQRGPLNLEQLLSMAVQVAEGMTAAHAQGVFHRDLKPANLLVRKEGDRWMVKIIDFGLALRQQTVETSKDRLGASRKSMLDWSVAGTLDYAAPEQLGKLPGVQTGPYSDVYAFGKTCWYAMFKATEQLRKQWNGLPEPLADLLEKCLDPDPRQRPQSFEPVLAILRELSRVGEETRRQEQEERLRQEQEEELRRQKEGEEGLRLLVRAALDRTGGKPTPDDTAAAKDLYRHHKLPTDRAKVIVREVTDAWRQEREERQREQERQEVERLQREREERRRREEEARKTAEAARQKREHEERQRQEAARQREEDEHQGVNLVLEADTKEQERLPQEATRWKPSLPTPLPGPAPAPALLPHLVPGVGIALHQVEEFATIAVKAFVGSVIGGFVSLLAMAIIMIPVGIVLALGKWNIPEWAGHVFPHLVFLPFTVIGCVILLKNEIRCWKYRDSVLPSYALPTIVVVVVLVAYVLFVGLLYHLDRISKTGKQSENAVLALKEHRVTSVAFSPDGKRIVSGSSDNTVKVWDADNGTEILTLKGHKSQVTGVSFSPDGKRIVSISNDCTLKMWDADKGIETFTLMGQTLKAFSAKGEIVWNVPFYSVAFSPDAKRIVTASGDHENPFLHGEVKVWDADKGTEILTLKGHRETRFYIVSYSADGKRIVSGGRHYGLSGLFKVWDADNGTEFRVIAETIAWPGVNKGPYTHNTTFSSVLFSPDDKHIVCASREYDRTGEIKVWDADRGTEILTLKGRTNGICNVSCSPDGKSIVGSSWDNTLTVWDADKGTEILTLKGHTDRVNSVSFSPDGKRIVSASYKEMKVWDADKGTEILTLK